MKTKKIVVSSHQKKMAQELMKDNKDHRLIYLKIQSELNAGAIVHENVKK
jgi:hypothetical protein